MASAFELNLQKLVLKLNVHQKRRDIAMRMVYQVIGTAFISMDLKEKTLTLIGNFDASATVKKLRRFFDLEIVYCGPAKKPEMEDVANKNKEKLMTGKKKKKGGSRDQAQVGELVTGSYRPNYDILYPAEELSSFDAGTSSTKESIDPATEKTHDLKGIEEHGMDSSLQNLPLSFDVQFSRFSVLVADDAYTSSFHADFKLPPFGDKVNDALNYCSLFPGEYEFEKNEVLQLWLADGMFKEEPMEVFAGQLFEHCLAKGYFEFSRFNFLRGEEMYTFKGDTHLISDGRVVSIEDSVNLNDLSPEVSHLSVNCRSPKDSRYLCQFDRFTQLKSLIFFQGHNLSLREIPFDFFIPLELLQTLILSDTDIEELPSSIQCMRCLSYLDITNTPIRYLPEELVCLEQLQILKLRGCSYISTLPEGMRRLRKLRHLYFDVVGQLRSMPKGMGDLTNIQTLSAFIVGKEDGCSIRQLKNMNELSGSFCIVGLQNVLTEEEAMEAYMCHKSKIKQLELRWSDLKDKDVSGQTNVLNSLEPNSSLEELTMCCYGGSRLPSWICHVTLSRLVSITLYHFSNCKVLPSFGQLPALKSLEIIGFNKLTVIDVEFYGKSCSEEYIAFPKLTSLTIDDMPSLEEWRDTEYPYFSQLVSLKVQQCPKLFRLCTLSSSLHPLKELEITDCGVLESCFDEKCPPPLQRFIIEDCLSLNERILKYKDYWFKLFEQISEVWIDHQQMSGSISSEEEEDIDELEDEEEEEDEGSD